MPYYIYRIKPFMQLDKLCEFDSFAQASAQAKILRTTEPTDPAIKIKVMFAENELQAEELLCQPRVAGPKGDD
ncbi:MAG: hypothetical protein PHQ58_07235 [Rhodoferax sp.]|uniref:hypothetical protein n=1 Tax=Rhodoferax sp. TaxID=50421 RepID=UPI002639182D|nr:hypothetical protein [Rhodoferax sp.]MDD2880214.1 hypothetical protein [Rhodoferax sp.]